MKVSRINILQGRPSNGQAVLLVIKKQQPFNPFNSTTNRADLIHQLKDQALGGMSAARGILGLNRNVYNAQLIRSAAEKDNNPDGAFLGFVLIVSKDCLRLVFIQFDFKLMGRFFELR